MVTCQGWAPCAVRMRKAMLRAEALFVANAMVAMEWSVSRGVALGCPLRGWSSGVPLARMRLLCRATVRQSQPIARTICL